MTQTTTRQEPEMTQYTSNRVFDGVRLLSPDRAGLLRDNYDRELAARLTTRAD